MNGIENIISKINNDSAARCEAALKKAEEECKAILAEADEKGAKLLSEAENAANAEAEKVLAMASSGAAQTTRRTILAEKVSIINQTISDLLAAMKALPEDKYFGAILKLAGENAMKGECTAKLSARDLGRMPASFPEALAGVLAEKGSTCVLSEEPASIGSGIMLIYGNIEVNCSFEAIIEDNSDMLKARAGEILF